MGGSDWVQGFAAKRKTCLVVLPKQSHNTAVEVAAEGERVCLFRFVCWHAFKPFTHTTLLCVNEVCEKGAQRKKSL